jgi:hypothetical protein
MIMDLRLLKRINALLPMEVTPFPMTTLVIALLEFLQGMSSLPGFPGSPHE